MFTFSPSIPSMKITLLLPDLPARTLSTSGTVESLDRPPQQTFPARSRRHQSSKSIRRSPTRQASGVSDIAAFSEALLGSYRAWATFACLRHLRSTHPTLSLLAVRPMSLTSSKEAWTWLVTQVARRTGPLPLRACSPLTLLMLNVYWRVRVCSACARIARWKRSMSHRRLGASGRQASLHRHRYGLMARPAIHWREMMMSGVTGECSVPQKSVWKDRLTASLSETSSNRLAHRHSPRGSGNRLIPKSLLVKWRFQLWARNPQVGSQDNLAWSLSHDRSHTANLLICPVASVTRSSLRTLRR